MAVHLPETDHPTEFPAFAPRSEGGFVRCRTGAFQRCDSVPRKGGERFRELIHIEPFNGGKLVRLGQGRLALRITCNKHQRHPMVTLFLIDIFAVAEKIDLADREAGFLFGFSAGCGEAGSR